MEVYCYSCHCEFCCGRDVYVGKAKNGTTQRHNAHVSAAKRIIENRAHKRDLKFDHFLAKHGIECCHVRTLATFETEDEMNNAEVELIDVLKTHVEFGGLNIDKGGKGGRKKGMYVPSDSTKKKQSESMKAHYERCPMTQEMKDRLSSSQIEAHKKDATLGRRKNLKSWATISARRDDVTYDMSFRAMMRTKAHKGGVAFLEKLKDEEFESSFSEKISSSVTNWCKNNPDLVKKRSQKALLNREKNGVWLERVRESSKSITKEERHRRVILGWETRRKNLMNNSKVVEENKTHDGTNASVDS
jgi:hypothetical protein